MKRSLIAFAAFLLSALLLVGLCACTAEGGNKAEETSGLNNEETGKNPDGTPKVYVDSIALDDARYTIGEFKKDVYEYTVGLPDGRPAVPRVSATAPAGVEVKVSQAAIPDEATEGTATVVASDAEGNTATYKIKFERSIVNGFVLQYDDRYVFNPGYYNATADKYVFTSDNPEVVSVDEDGVMHAKKLSETPVTLTATLAGEVKATFIVDRVEKAHINLFFITGQSNGQGCYDSTNYGKDVANLVAFEDQLALVEPIGGLGRVYSYDVFPRSQNTAVAARKGTMYDMELYVKQGHQASLGKAFYDLSGEKVVFLQSAYSGAPIESWLDPKRHDEGGMYGGYNFYTQTQSAYKKLIKKLADNYEIVYVANFWCQGETAMTSVYSKQKGDYIFSSDPAFKSEDRITDETYYKYFMMLHEDMKADFGLQYNGIMFVKTKGWTNQTTKIVPIVSAHFALCNNNDDIHVATRTFIEIARMYSDSDKTSEGYGFMGTDNNHYNQIGYNYHGKEAGTNAFNAIFGVATNVSEGVEIIANDGIKRLDSSSQSISLKVGSSVRLGALSVPHYINEKIVWSSSDTGIATVNEFGEVTGVAVGKVTITATAESGKSQSVDFLILK